MTKRTSIFNLCNMKLKEELSKVYEGTLTEIEEKSILPIEQELQVQTFLFLPIF